MYLHHLSEINQVKEGARVQWHKHTTTERKEKICILTSICNSVPSIWRDEFELKLGIWNQCAESECFVKVTTHNSIHPKPHRIR
jgi:hypothetical protein